MISELDTVLLVWRINFFQMHFFSLLLHIIKIRYPTLNHSWVAVFFLDFLFMGCTSVCNIELNDWFTLCTFGRQYRTRALCSFWFACDCGFCFFGRSNFSWMLFFRRLVLLLFFVCTFKWLNDTWKDAKAVHRATELSIWNIYSSWTLLAIQT